MKKLYKGTCWLQMTYSKAHNLPNVIGCVIAETMLHLPVKETHATIFNYSQTQTQRRRLFFCYQHMCIDHNIIIRSRDQRDNIPSTFHKLSHIT